MAMYISLPASMRVKSLRKFLREATMTQHRAGVHPGLINCMRLPVATQVRVECGLSQKKGSAWTRQEVFIIEVLSICLTNNHRDISCLPMASHCATYICFRRCCLFCF